MRINKISQLRYGVFRDFKWPDGLEPFDKYNLIYGWNGSGRTTISQIFRALEKCNQFPDPEDPVGGDVTLTIDGSEVSGRDFPDQFSYVRVFNRDFIEENVFCADGDIDPIFILGKENIKNQKRIEGLKKELDETGKLLEAEKKETKDAELKFEKHCRKGAKDIKDRLRLVRVPSDYDKRDYEKRAKEMVEKGDDKEYLLSDGERKTFEQQIRDAPKSSINKLEYQVPDLESLASDVSALLDETVASQAIQSLKNDPELSDWVSKGFDLHKARDATECLYCEQEILPPRLASLEGHFDDSYKQFVKKLGDKERKVKELSDEVSDLLSSLPDKARFYGDLVEEYENACSDLEETLAKIKKFLGSLDEKLKEKKGKPFAKVSMNELLPAIDDDVLGKLNSVIDRHNQRSNDIQSTKEGARKRLEKDWVVGSLKKYQELKNKIQECEKLCNEWKEKEEGLEKDIEASEKEDHQVSAEELNKDLYDYLGHNELQLKIEEKGYTIVRHGTPAKGTLSEGEKTAIALLYFLKSLEDHEFNIKKGVVVLDDPVSSLDDSALHLAVAFIKERTQKAGQLFVFTHNFMFFRLVREWFKFETNSRKLKDLKNLYMLNCIKEDKSQHRSSRIQTLDPLLKEYKSEYHYLFARIYWAAKKDKKTKKGLEDKYHLLNMARRLLETFLEFCQPDQAQADSRNFWKKLKGVKNFARVEKEQIYQLVTSHSHGPTLVESEGLLQLNKVNEILNNVLELIEHEYPRHYKAMENLPSMPNQNSRRQKGRV